ncbi:MAG: proton-conducting transporter membrane subunit, partial [Candidatus Aenigmatarchaeota archaeon]
VSTSLILLGIGLIYGLAGTFTLADIALRYQNNIIFTTALGLLLTGFAIKAAIVPFHFWKPDATVGAVEPVAALFSSLSVAMGFYGLTRMLFIFNLIEISWVLIGTGMLTMAVGAVMALIQADIKRLLAYSTISQMGFCLISLGTGTEAGISAALFQVLNNAIAKVVLFLCVGAIILSAGKSNMNELGGLARKMPLTAGCFLIGSLAVVGIPPLSGFASKYMIYFATWEVSPLLTAFALIFSGFTLAYYLKAFSSIFLGPESDINATKKAPATMLIPVIALSVLIVVIGFFPQTGLAIVEPATSSLLNLPNYISTVLGV